MPTNPAPENAPKLLSKSYIVTEDGYPCWINNSGTVCGIKSPAKHIRVAVFSSRADAVKAIVETERQCERYAIPKPQFAVLLLAKGTEGAS